MSEKTKENSRLPETLKRGETILLLGAVFVTSICGLAYELVIGATGAYIAGDGVRQFAFTIGLFLSSMGFGSFLSRKVSSGQALQTFISAELMIGLLGGISHPSLYLLYAYTQSYETIFYALLVVIGGLTGLEIPLITRILSKSSPLRINISNVLSLDYMGALITTVLFPLFLLPHFGLWYTSVFFGLINTILGGILLFSFRKASWFRKILPGFLFTMATLLMLAGGGRMFMAMADGAVYNEEIVFAKFSQYQRIVLTRWRTDLRLYLNGNIQFSSYDEYRYHEALVHPLMTSIPSRERILVLGGGDGLAVREIFKYKDVRHVDLVDLDPEVVKLARTNVHLKELNKNSLNNPKLHYHPEDAWKFAGRIKGLYNAIIVDLPDPSSENLVKVYSKQFYKLLSNHLAADGAMVVQATSPYFNRRSFWCIVRTVRATGLFTKPIHAHVPSFGEWGFVLAAPHKIISNGKLSVPVKYLKNRMLETMAEFPGDLNEEQVGISTLDHPVILSYYLEDYKKYFK
ncbi:MAG: polyamine aminopropyltransferase [Deltaproteobacteria bacterium]|nr:polyamine aminopropyltransferase [Deltaproteobacteria bacterium]